MKGKLENRNALVTGGSRGIGLAIATRFASEGANVFICATDPRRLDKAASELRQFRKKVVAHACDVSDQKAVGAMVQYALAELGQVDILVNNAGVYKAARFLDYSAKDFDRIMKVDLYGVFHVTQAILPGMIARKKGKVINIASTAGKWGSRYQSAYNAAKHAVVGLTRCVALEMAPYNINVNAICPGVTETDAIQGYFEDQASIRGLTVAELRKTLVASMVPLGRIIDPKQIAHLALYLASDESDDVTAQSISVCGGYIMV